MSANYRDPYPSLREQIYWFYVRWFTRRDVPEKAWVRIQCPKTDEVIATENTDPQTIDRDVEGATCIASYGCPYCESAHQYVWGAAPAPIYAGEKDA